MDSKEDCRLGRVLKRLIGDAPVVSRGTPDDRRFLLSDLSDLETGRRVRERPPLQLATSQDAICAPLGLDIDSLHTCGCVPVSEALHAIPRARAAAQLISTVLFNSFGLRVHWFGSGKQGLHGWAFVSLSKAHRRAIAELLLPASGANAEPLFQRAAEHYEGQVAVCAVVNAAIRRLSQLDSTADPDWHARMVKACAPKATFVDKLCAITAFFDIETPTIAGRLRVPCSFNDKGEGYLGFPLPPFAQAWPVTLCRPAATGATLSGSELEILESLCRPSHLEIRDVLTRLTAAFKSSKKRSRVDDELHRSYIPRLSSDTCIELPPEGSKARLALLPERLRLHLSKGAIQALERGVERGGAPPACWIPEPDNEHRRSITSRGGGLGNDPTMPLALLALTGLDLPAPGRSAVVRSLATSHFPADAFAEAMAANASKMRELPHWSSWFHTFAVGANLYAALAWRYESGRFEAARLQCPTVRSHCGRAASLLDGKYKSKPRSVASCAAAPRDVPHQHVERTFTGRVVQLHLDRSAQDVLESLHPALATRARVEGRDSPEGLIKHARTDLAHLYNNADAEGTVVLREYISDEGRLSYVAGSFAGIKAVLVEVRRELFSTHWRVDIKRCHTTMLLGCYTRARALGCVGMNKTLDRLCNDLEGIEAALRADQDRLLPAAQARLQSTIGTPDEVYARRFIGYLKEAPKTLLSALLNHANDSPMWRTWPLAASICHALGVAAGSARTHPLVLGDPKRPQVCGLAAGGSKEKPRLACLLERRAVQVIIESFHSVEGLQSGLTINDEVLFTATQGVTVEVEALKRQLVAAIASRLGFEVRLTIEPIVRA